MHSPDLEFLWVSQSVIPLDFLIFDPSLRKDDVFRFHGFPPCGRWCLNGLPFRSASFLPLLYISNEVVGNVMDKVIPYQPCQGLKTLTWFTSAVVHFAVAKHFYLRHIGQDAEIERITEKFSQGFTGFVVKAVCVAFKLPLHCFNGIRQFF